MPEPIENLRRIRLEKLQKIKKLGINPYPARCIRKQTISQALKMMGEKVAVAGRIMAIRGHGGIQFFDLRDESGKIQFLLKKDKLSIVNCQLLILLDIGDFIDASGTVTKTQAGEISILVDTFHLLTKSIRPLPSQWYGLKDTEERYRKRYLDLLIDSDKKKLFERKSKFWEVNREFMKGKGFLEVETPIMEHVTGGADAKPFITHHNALNEDFYLRISTELYQKRLIGAGFEKIYTLGPNFRNEGMDDEHLQEFYQIEWYWAYADYRQNMKMVEEMFNYIAREVYGKTKFTKGNHTFDISKKWDEIDYHQIIKEKMKIDIFDSSEREMLKVLANHKVKLEGKLNSARIVDDLWKIIRKDVTGPAFLINEPKFTSPLAKSKTEDERFTERFHVIIAGTELGNGYSELNDPQDQLERFKEQQQNREKGDEEAQMMDLDFVEMLEYGMPPTSGYAHSERLFWFLENITAREGTLFPQMKNLIDPLTLKMYGLKLTKQPVYDSKQKPPTLPEIKEVEQQMPKSLGITRAKAIELLKKYLKEEKEFNHLYATEVAMDYYAKKYGGNSEAWKLAGLLHDLDWDYVNGDIQRHGKVAAEILKKEGVCRPIVYSILAHVGFPEYPRKTKMDSALWGSEELTGLILALVKGRPDKQIINVTKESVLKVYKSLNFASGVNRKVIRQGAEELGISLEEHISNVLGAMRTIEYSL